jgi:large subunit ribosomal protein L24
MEKIKKGDKVIVLTGKEKGKEGTITRILRDAQKVIIEGVNLRKKTVKAGQGNQGGIIDVASPMHISNVALIDPKTNKPTRVGFKVDGDKKVRIAKKSGKEV